MLQNKVNRQYTEGFPGQFVLDGPHRAISARIVKDTDSGIQTNLFTTHAMSRAFGYYGDSGTMGMGKSLTHAANNASVVIGGKNFFGLLCHSYRYPLRGDALGTLNPSYHLPDGAVGEFTSMTTGLIAEVFNYSDKPYTIEHGFQLIYVTNSNASQTLPIGALIAVSKADAASMTADGKNYQIIENSRVIDDPLTIDGTTADHVSTAWMRISL